MTHAIGAVCCMCPGCSPAAYLAAAKIEAQSTPAGWTGEWSVTGEEHWLRAVAHVRRVNPQALPAILAELGPVATRVPADSPQGYAERWHNLKEGD